MYMAKMKDVELPLLGGILPSNRVHADHAIAKVLASGKRRIGMIWLSFKPGTDDLRESPLVLLAEQFIGKGLNLLVYDPEVHLSRLLGANSRFIEEHVPHIGAHLRSDIESVIAESDLLVVGLDDARIFESLERHVRPDQIVLDLVRLPAGVKLRGQVMGLAW
jgi:GDP-mannose 6-dehydrogenase